MMAQQRGALTFCVTAVGQVHRSFVVSSSSLVMVAQSRGALSPLAPLSLRMVALRSCAPSCFGRPPTPVTIGHRCGALPPVMPVPPLARVAATRRVLPRCEVAAAAGPWRSASGLSPLEPTSLARMAQRRRALTFRSATAGQGPLAGGCLRCALPPVLRGRHLPVAQVRGASFLVVWLSQWRIASAFSPFEPTPPARVAQRRGALTFRATTASQGDQRGVAHCVPSCGRCCSCHRL